MNLKTKIFLTALTVIGAVTAYPTYSAGDDGKAKNIVLSSDNLVVLNGEINDESVAKVSSSLLALDRKTTKFGKQKPINLYIYSPGGNIQSGLELIELAKGLKRPVNTITMFAASMAFQTVQNLGERNILKNGLLMSHRAAGGMEGSFGGLAPSQLDKRYAFWLQRIKELDEQTVARTNGKQTMEKYLASYANEMWITGNQAVQEGYADSVVTVTCDESLNGVESHETNFMGFSVHYDTSKCPLVTGLLNVKLDQPGGDATNSNPILEEVVKAKFLTKFQFLGELK